MIQRSASGRPCRPVVPRPKRARFKRIGRRAALAAVVAALLALTMLGALVLVHLPAGFFAADGGVELVLLLAAASVLFVLAGAGRWSLDHLVAARRRGSARA